MAGEKNPAAADTSGGGLKFSQAIIDMDVTIKGIPIEKLLEVYEKYEGHQETKHDRDKRYREAHKEAIKKKNHEYYLKRKETHKAQAAPPGESGGVC